MKTGPLFALALTALTLPAPPARAAGHFDPAPVDALVAEALKRWQAPGMAVAVVRDDEVVYLKGHGVRQRGGKEPVTPDTLFAIGSCTKAFTAIALGVLVDEKKADWDDKVRKHVPSFRLADPLADRDVTLRDLLCHRSGLAAHDLLWYRAPWPVEEGVRRMAFLPPASSFRSKYRYNNLGYQAAGLAISSAAKRPWHEFVRKELFEPLGMKGAVFTRSEALKAADHATPHRRGPGGKPQPIDWYPDDRQIRASGSIKAGARDLSRWVRMQLAGGSLEGKRVVSAEALAETHAPQIVVPLDRTFARLAGTTQVSYGLGWRIFDYRGQRVLEHGGAVDGFRALVVLVPGKKVGLVVLANLEETAAVSATGYTLLDHVLGLPRLKKDGKDWHDHFREQVKQSDEAREARRARLLKSRRPRAKPSRELKAYAGAYRDRAYGRAEVRLEGERLVLCWSRFKVPLDHLLYNTFVVPQQKEVGPHRLSLETVLFTLDGEGRVATLRFLGRTFRRE
jgi:CubicO group peptidase (beta-lactamase class C family)